MAYVPNSGSVVAFQGDPSQLQASITGTVTIRNGASISGTVIANQGTTPWVVTGSVQASPVANQSVSGTISVTTTDIFPATQNITVVDSASSTATGANGQSIVIGTPTAGSAASFSLSGIATVRVEVTGIWTGTIVSEFSIDGGTTWTSQGLHQGAYTTSSWTAGFIGGGNVAGATNYRIRATAAITGTVTVKVVESVNEQSVYIANAAPAGNVISLNNSTTATLTSGSVYTGTGEDVSNFSEMRISVFSDVASATDGLSLQQSTNNTNWDIIDTYTIAAATGKTFVIPRQARYFRIVYTNGGTNQASFRLQSILNRTATAPSSQRPTDAYTNETDLVQNQTFGMVYNGTTWDRSRGNATQGTQVFGSVTGTVGASIIGVVPIVISSVIGAIPVTGTLTPSQGASVSGTVGASIIGQLPAGTAVLGSIAALQGTNPWIVVSSIAGGIFPISGSVAATITNANLNVSGSVVAFQGGTQVTSLVSTIPSSVIVGASIFGALPAGNAILGAVAASISGTVNVAGSVVAFQGTNPWVIQSVVGTYAEDIAFSNNDKGLLTIGVRNDTVSSFVGTDLDYTPHSSDSAGRTLIRPFAAEEARVEGYASLVSTSVTTLITNPGAGLRNYVTDIIVANTGATTTLVTFRSQGGGSVLGYTIAPAGGGSNMIGFQTPMRSGVNETFDFQPTSSSSILFVTVKGFKAP